MKHSGSAIFRSALLGGLAALIFTYFPSVVRPEQANSFSSLRPAALSVHAVSETVTFHANGGTGEMDAAVLEAGKDKLPACTFTRYGYVFRGWMTNPAGSLCALGAPDVYHPL